MKHMQDIRSMGILMVVSAFMSTEMAWPDETKITTGTPERIRTGFQFTEGPAWDGQGALFLRHSRPANYRLTEGNDLTIFREPSNRSNGFDEIGGLSLRL